MSEAELQLCKHLSQLFVVMQKEQVRDLQQVLQNIEQQQELVIDARGAGRFQGSAPEPRAGMRGGHIPHSRNVPFDAVLSDGRSASTVHSYLTVVTSDAN